MQEPIKPSRSEHPYKLRRTGLKADKMPLSCFVLFKQTFLGILIAAHCFMIVIGPLAINLSRFGRLGDVLYYYGEAAGTNTRYAFFSPGISVQIRVRFIIRRNDGVAEVIDFLSGRNREADLRLGDISDQFLTIAALKEPMARKLQRRLAASLAASVFSRKADAKSVVVIIEEFVPKPLRAQEPYPPPQWRKVYSIEFIHQKRGGTR